MLVALHFPPTCLYSNERILSATIQPRSYPALLINNLMESPESPRICFFFIPGDQPLGNGISAFPDPDDSARWYTKPPTFIIFAQLNTISFEQDL
jgi:hypothetical protein